MGHHASTYRGVTAEAPLHAAPRNLGASAYQSVGSGFLVRSGVKAGVVAAALAMVVSGGAYATVRAAEPTGPKPLAQTQTSLSGIGNAGAEGTTSQGLTVQAPASSVSTVSEDAVEAHGTIQQETDGLPQGQTRVKTKGVDGVTRTTYQVTSQDGVEVSRVAISSVVVTAKVDEVVLVGTGKAQVSQSESSTSSSSASSGSTSGSTGSGGGSTSGGSGSGGGQAAPAPSAPAASGDPQSIARSMLASYGWGDDQFQCLVNLWNKESGWNPGARNKSSGAYGIPQALPGNKMASAGADWQTNPATQIKWGLGYISGRYGSPCGAWAHSKATGWY